LSYKARICKKDYGRDSVKTINAQVHVLERMFEQQKYRECQRKLLKYEAAWERLSAENPSNLDVVWIGVNVMSDLSTVYRKQSNYEAQRA
jgi:hypothetical protein